jgi:uncharacterized protein YjbI with pentapeptide repeats
MLTCGRIRAIAAMRSHPSTLTDANLKNANLTRAILNGADLTRAVNLTHKQLREAVVDEATRLPELVE